MKWKLEEWVYPIRDKYRQIVKLGRWKLVPAVDDEKTALDWVADARAKGLVRRARGPDGVEAWGYPHSFYIIRPRQ